MPPDYLGEIPSGYFTDRSELMECSSFGAALSGNLKQLQEPVKVMEHRRMYPLGKEASAKAMQCPDASGVPANMLYPQDGAALEMLARFIEHEYVDLPTCICIGWRQS